MKFRSKKKMLGLAALLAVSLAGTLCIYMRNPMGKVSSHWRRVTSVLMEYIFWTSQRRLCLHRGS